MSEIIKSKVFILYTGGTIGMGPEDGNSHTRALVPKSLNELIKWIPGWGKASVEHNLTTNGMWLQNGIYLGFDAFQYPLDSANITPDDWLDIARKIQCVYDEYDGFVILHGTDTMAYTASGLAFIFENLAKPVVLTGSQLPISDERSDAIINLVNAIYIAGWKSVGLVCIPEVVICFADKILRGCRATKVSTSAWAGFDSPNFPPLGNIGERIDINEKLLLQKPRNGQCFTICNQLNTAVLDIILSPGLKQEYVDKMMRMTGIKAVLLRTYGAGNAPMTSQFLNTMEQFIEQGNVIVNISQCMQGQVEMGKYATSFELRVRGVISGVDMTPEAVLAKLYWSLGNQIGAQIPQQMQICQRGEQS